MSDKAGYVQTDADADFEDMLAAYDRIIHDKALQQELLDAGLLVRVDPETGEPIDPAVLDALNAEGGPR